MTQRDSSGSTGSSVQCTSLITLKHVAVGVSFCEGSALPWLPSNMLLWMCHTVRAVHFPDYPHSVRTVHFPDLYSVRAVYFPDYPQTCCCGCIILWGQCTSLITSFCEGNALPWLPSFCEGSALPWLPSFCVDSALPWLPSNMLLWMYYTVRTVHFPDYPHSLRAVHFPDNPLLFQYRQIDLKSCVPFCHGRNP